MFEIINNSEFEIKEIDTLEKYIEFVVKKQGLEDAIFNIIFVTKEEIHKINKEYRNVDRPTDVITFALEDNKDESDSVIRVLGDIYISIEIAYEQAEIYGHSNLREVCFLATHGILHLLGYDHMEESEEKIMFNLQEELLNEYKITR